MGRGSVEEGVLGRDDLPRRGEELFEFQVEKFLESLFFFFHCVHHLSGEEGVLEEEGGGVGSVELELKRECEDVLFVLFDSLLPLFPQLFQIPLHSLHLHGERR